MGNADNKRSLRRLATCALWIVVWQAASLIIGSDILLAGPLETCTRLLAIVQEPRFLSIVWFSFSRIASGFLGAFVLGIALGFIAHRWPLVQELLEPAVLAFKSIPVACIVVLLLIWVGSREVSGLAVFLMAFPALYLATLEGLAQLDRKVDEMLLTFGVGGLRRFLAHEWPSVLPYLLATSRNACGMAWKAGVAAELIGSPLGSMGERIYQAKILLETADLFAWTVVVVAVSYACERLFLWILAATGPVSLHLAVPSSSSPSRKAAKAAPEPQSLVARDATLGYDGVVVQKGVNVILDEGARGILSDASGTGKTTLLHTFARLIAPIAGTVQAPEVLSMVFQESRLIEGLSAEQNVLLVDAGGRSYYEIRKLLLELLPEDALGHPVSELSGGQRRRVEIIRALAHPSAAVLLDEPFSSLDEKSHQRAAACVLELLAGRTLLVASHAAEDVELLDAKRVALSGHEA